MTVWLEYERSCCLHEQRSDLLGDWIVTMPELSTKEGRWEAGQIQKYETKDGKVRWRSLTPKRTTFREGYTSRERCAQELVTECPAVLRTIEYRKQRLALRPLTDLSLEARNASLG